jgi:superfamily II DNA/RNA helicase
VLKKNKKSLGFDKIYKITGKISLEERESVEDLIGNKDIIIITSAGSESINLQKANCIIFYDIPYSVKTSIQVIGRICRRDTKHSFQYVILLYTKGTIDEYKYLIFQDNLKMVKASVGIAEDIPLEILEVDKAGMKKLRDKLLWVYKNKSTDEVRKRKKLVRSRLFLSNSNNWQELACNYNFLVEPLEVCGTMFVEGLSPDKLLYERYLRGDIPFTMLRSKYLESLKSEDSQKLMNRIVERICNDVCVVNLIGDTDLNKVLYEEILKCLE